MAKRFYRISEEDPEIENMDPTQTPLVNIRDHKLHIQSEMARIVLGKWFLSAFYRFTKSAEVTVFESELPPCLSYSYKAKKIYRY